MARPPHLAIFLATSGHSGVDRLMRNLIAEFAHRGLAVDLLRIANHGPHMETVPEGVRLVDLGAAHVATAFLPLVRYLRRERPRVLLSDKDKVNRTALWARRLAGGETRVVVRLGTTVSVNLASRTAFDRTLQRWSMRRFYSWADAVVVPSQGVADDLAAFAGLRRGEICVVSNPVVTTEMARLARPQPDHPWFTQGAPPVILGVGELSERKDFATLVRAFAHLRARRPCHLVILGEGRRRGELEHLASERGVADDVWLPGFVPNPYPYMARAAAFALTSRWEGLGIVLVEALALGTPVVACDCPSGPREVLADGRHGPLVPVGDDVALAEALADLLANPRPREVLQAAAQPFSAAASARAYAAVLGLELPA